MILTDNPPKPCETQCGCKQPVHDTTRFVVLTGGPGAGKTAVLEIIRKMMCEHVAILPEAASVVFNGGFWRLNSNSARRAAQRAIFHIQREMELLVSGEHRWALGMCDRGVLDGLAYWPGEQTDFWNILHTTIEAEYAHYSKVIHLRTPSHENGYNHDNPLRLESADEAAQIDERIQQIWCHHPNYHVVESTSEFIDKVQTTIKLVVNELPQCCRGVLA